MPEQKQTSEVLDETKQQEPEQIKYSEEEQEYLSALQIKLEKARDQRDQAHDEFDGMTYIARYQDENQLANTYIKPKSNKHETTFVSGTIRQKLMALLAAVNNLNLEPDYSAFDSEELEIAQLGNALNIVRQKTEELENDEEKRLMREYELLVHGTVFVEDIWGEEWQKEKKLNGKFDGKMDVKWTERLKKVFEGPTRSILYGPSVYLGNIRQFFIEKQPYVFTVDVKHYNEAKAIYGKWERWKYVPKKLREFNKETQQNRSILYGNWSLTTLKDNYVEIVKFQDKWGNEFQILINGIPMLPMGFPLTAISPSGEYTIAQQNGEIITPQFAYGRSFVSRLKNSTALLDEMLRLLILKAQKSFMPARANLTGRVLSSKVFMPGEITQGINPDLVKAFDTNNRDTNNVELETIKMLTENIDQNSVSPTFTGNKASGDPTATEILELQRQARMVLGLTIFVMAMLEKKLGILRLHLILDKWFDPVDEKVDEARGLLVNKYRIANVEDTIEDEGLGNMMVIPSDNQDFFPADSEAQKAMSEQLFREEDHSVKPLRKILLNPDQLRKAKLTWRVTVNPTEVRSSERAKLMFERMLGSAIKLFQGQLNMKYVADRFAETWEENPSKLFQKQNPMIMPPAVTMAGQQGTIPTTVKPEIALAQGQQPLPGTP